MALDWRKTGRTALWIVGIAIAIGSFISWRTSDSWYISNYYHQMWGGDGYSFSIGSEYPVDLGVEKGWEVNYSVDYLGKVFICRDTVVVRQGTVWCRRCKNVVSF